MAALHLGRPATAAEIAAADSAVFPNGAGLPPGQGMAQEGYGVYMAKCATCHGDDGQGGGVYPALVGGRGTLATATPDLTVGSYWPYATTVWDYIHWAMPYPQPGSLTPNQAYAVTAYILYLNKIIPYREVLNSKTLPTVRMPNRNGFMPDPRPDVP